jgi:hypothetical protein
MKTRVLFALALAILLMLPLGGSGGRSHTTFTPELTAAPTAATAGVKEGSVRRTQRHTLWTSDVDQPNRRDAEPSDRGSFLTESQRGASGGDRATRSLPSVRNRTRS